MNRVVMFITIASFVVFVCHASLAYDDKHVHPQINEEAARQSNVDIFARKYFGFAEGIETKLYLGTSQKKIWEWLRQGGTDEDGTSDSTLVDIMQGRYLRHFHDPLEPWSDAGLAAFSSNLVWAQKQDTVSGDYSWSAAREHYYQALITQYESEFAQTFLTLGHLMHLVADMAVPAHVRSDAHPGLPGPPSWKSDLYEKWARYRSLKWEKEEHPAGDDSFITRYFTGLTPSLSIFAHASLYPENRPCAA